MLTNSTFLNHLLPILLLAQISMHYYVWKKEIACKRCQRLQAKERLTNIFYHG